MVVRGSVGGWVRGGGWVGGRGGKGERERGAEDKGEDKRGGEKGVKRSEPRVNARDLCETWRKRVWHVWCAICFLEGHVITCLSCTSA